MFDFSIANILHSNLFNFLIMFSIFVLIAKKLKLFASIEKNKQNIINSINDAVHTKEKSHNALKEAEEKVKNVVIEVEGIASDAVKALKSLEQKMVADTEKHVKNIESTIEKVVSSEIGKVNLKLTKGVSNASVALAKQNIETMLESNKELHEKFIYDAIDELDKVEL